MQNIVTIKPKIIFKHIEQAFKDQYVIWNVGIPSTEIGGMTLLESSILVSLIKIFKLKNIFEFGTYMGATSILFALNTPCDAKITSLDIDPLNFSSSDIDLLSIFTNDKSNDAFLRDNVINYGAKYIKNADQTLQDKITLLFCDSLKFNPSEFNLANSFDLILIDGGHDYETIKKDTENALLMLKDNGIIVWHDYKSYLHTDVTKYIESFSNSYKIYHVENTMIAFMLYGSLRFDYE